MKKSIFLVIIVLTALSFSTPVFPWTNTCGWDGDDAGYDVVQTSGGFYLAIGSTKTLGGLYSNVYQEMAFSSGFQASYNVFGQPGFNVIGRCINPASDGGYVIAGTATFLGTGYSYFYLARLDDLANFAWSKNFGEPGHSSANSVTQTTDGGYAIIGNTDAFGAGADDAYLIKTDVDGNCVWTRTYGWAGPDYGRSVILAPDGGYVMAGTTNSDMWLMKADASGDCVWSMTYGGPAAEECYSACNTSDGGYILAGYTYSFGAGGKDVYLVKTDADGNCVWSRTYGGIDADSARSIQRTSDGGYIIAGTYASIGIGPNNIYLLKVNAAGDLSWQSIFYGGQYDYGYSAKQTADGGYIVAGVVGSFGTFGAGGTDMILIKTDANGIHNSPPTITVTRTITPTRTLTMTPTITMTPTAMGYSWGGTGLWHGIAAAAADAWTGQARPFTGSSPFTWWYGEDATGTYFNANVSNSGELTTPFMNINPDEALYFWSWEQTEKRLLPALSDTRKIYISADSGSTWTLLKECYGVEDQWYNAFIDLSAYSGQAVIFKFVFDTVDNFNNGYRGWFLDDIMLGAIPTPTATVTDTPVCSPTITATYFPESGWSLAVDPAAFGARVGHCSVVFDNKIWVIGGNNGSYLNDVWYSSNGIDWALATGNAAFSPRFGHAAVVFDNKMWVIGGATYLNPYYLNDVWYSTDGITWVQATPAAAFAKRAEHSSVVFGNKIWVLGGMITPAEADAWYSSNGVDWVQATGNAAYGPRNGHASAVFDNKMWVIGGHNGSDNLNDVWNSLDGITWTQATANAAFSARSMHTCLEYNDQIWVIGGHGTYTGLSDVWFSTDGSVWQQATANAEFGLRSWHTSVVFMNKMWAIAGAGEGSVMYNDAWFSPAGLLPGTTATNTYTNTPVCSPTLTPTISPTSTYMVEKDWVLATGNAAFPGRNSHSSVVFDGKMWLIAGIAGATVYDDVWYSGNGVEWTNATSNAAFTNRFGQASVVFNGQMYVIGGRVISGAYKRDVWESLNGADWTALTENAEFPGRSGHSCVVFDNKIWVIGGLTGGVLSGDVWYSVNGVNWVQATANAAFGPRADHASVVFDNKMWVIGGNNGDRLNDVWYSGDGVTWTQAAINAGFSPRYRHSSVVYNGKIWVIGGQDQNLAYLKDVWWSENGINWQLANGYPLFSGRSAHTSVVFDGRMWVIAGTTGNKEVWYSPPVIIPTATVSQTPAITMTSTPSSTVVPAITETETGTITATPADTDTMTPLTTATLTVTSTVTIIPALTMTPTQSATQVQEPADLYFTESPVLFPNPSLNGAFNVRYTASKTADFCMKIYTMGYRRVREITKKGLPPSQNIITADIGATGNMAAGIYYYVITLKGRDNETLFTKPSHFIIIK